MGLIEMEAYESDFLKKATNAYDALTNAKNFILFVGKGTVSNNTVALSIIIPVAALESNPRIWLVSDSYNNTTHIHLQIRINSTSVYNGDTGLFYGANLVSDATYEYYYC